ncbi:CU044_5270 family protein [Streptomyces sp. NPDC097640]|uniref:CU044_5270 family protein n=1 Tax=Streptomyces sp. NPDC097640 TaxID=3157229 RepID=UPI00331BFFF7
MNDIPTLPERDLPPGRHRLLKEHLMHEIRQDDARTAQEPRRPWLRPAALGPALAGALALAVVGGIAVTGANDGEGVRVGPDGKATYAFAPRVNGDTRDNAPEVLGRIATVAERSAAHSSASSAARPTGKPGEKPPADGGIRDDQYVYIDSKVAFTTQENGGPAKLDPLHRREIWLSVDGLHTGLLREPGRKENAHQPLEPAPASGKFAYDRSTSYRYLQALPTDPDRMLKWIYGTVEKRKDRERSPDQDAFVLVGDLISESLMPPKVSAALYRAAAKIPGVVVVPDAVDAAGRHGVAVARVDSGHSAIREELIFNEKTGEYLGERNVALEDGDDYRAGQVIGTAAVLKRAVVDRPDQRP